MKLTKLRLSSLLILICIFLATPYSGISQFDQWYFGQYAGIDFSSGSPVATVGSLYTNEGSASISDDQGNLLFYTDGITVYNSVHAPMSGSLASSPGGALGGDPSATQSGVIVPKPMSTTEYYIFTVDANTGAYGLRHSKVDMSLNGGLGDLVLGEKNIPLINPSAEKITAVQHANNIDYWVISHKWANNQYVAYLVTSAGVSATPVISPVGAVMTGTSAAARGYLKASPWGNYVVSAIEGLDKFELFNFDNSNGVLTYIGSTPVSQNYNDAYGVEFSANENYLYGSQRWGDGIYQWDLTLPAANIFNAAAQVGTLSTNYGGALQMAPDGKIYLARNNQAYLSTINNPSNYGLACGFTEIGFNLASGTNSREGLPNGTWVQAIQNFIVVDVEEETCMGSADGSIEISVNTSIQYDSILWSDGFTGLNRYGLSAGSYVMEIYSMGVSLSSQTVVIDLSNGLNVSSLIANSSNVSPNSGLINLSVTGGQTPYTFMWSNGATSQNLTNLSAATYTVTVVDANLCASVTDITIGESTVPPWYVESTSSVHSILIPGNATITLNQDSIEFGDYLGVFYDSLGTLACAGYTLWVPFNNTLEAYGKTVFGGATNGFANGEEFIWKIWKSNGQELFANATYDPSKPHQQFFANGGYSGLLTLIEDTIQVLDFTLETTNNSCFGVYDGAAELVNLSGNPPFIINWSTGASGLQINNLTYGLYQVTVTDQAAYPQVVQFEITMPDQLQVNSNILNSIPSQGILGSIQLLANGGTPPYSYSWSNGSALSQVQNLLTGTYTVETTDINGCSLVTSHDIIDITNATDIAVTAAFYNNPGCALACNGSIGLLPTGGIAPYSYHWSTGDTTPVLSYLCAGTYDVTVMGANGGAGSFPWTYANTGISHTILVQPAVQFSGFTLQPGDYIGVFYDNLGTPTCGGYSQWTGGSIAITAWGDDSSTGDKDGFDNAETFSFRAYKASNGVINQLLVTYNTNMPNQGIYYTNGMSELLTLSGVQLSGPTFANLSFTLTDPATPTISSTLSNYFGYNISTPSASDGSITIDSYSGLVSPLIFEWSNGQVGAQLSTIDNLSSGIYYLTITGNNGCSLVDTFYIVAPPATPFVVSSVSTNISCYGYNNGTVDLNITGGIPPYSFIWSNGETTEDIDNLSTGVYTVTVTDNYAASYEESFYMNSPGGFLYLPTIIPANSLYGTDGALLENYNNFPQPYTLLWSTGETAANITGLSAGDYYLTVTASNGCMQEFEYTVGFNDSIIPVAPVTSDESQFIEDMLEAPCGDVDIFNATYTGDPYSLGYFIRGNSAMGLDSGIVLSTGYAADIVGPNYSSSFSTSTLGGSDSLLTANFGITTDDAAAIEFDFTACQDSFKLEYIFGSEEYPENLSTNDPFLILITGPAPPGQAPYVNHILSTIPGTNIPVGIPTVNDTANAIYYMDNNPVFSYNTFGEFDGYTVPFFAEAAIVPCETYHVKIVIADGDNDLYDSGIFFKARCDWSPYSMNASMNIQHVNCNAENNGSAIIENLTGTPPYIYQWSNGLSTSDTLQNLYAGDYNLTVWDADNQVLTMPFTITEPEELVITETIINPPCAYTLGSIEISCNGGTPPYTYSWSDGSTQTNLIDVHADTYELTLSDNNNCSLTNTYTIVEPEAIINSIEISLCEGEQYYFNGNIITSSGLYTDVQINSMGCDSFVMLNVGVFPLPEVSMDAPLEDTVDVNVMFIDLPAGYPSGGTYSGLGVVGSTFSPSDVGLGTYTIYYEYNNGLCSNTDSIEISVLNIEGISEAGLGDLINLYPNPVKDKLTIVSDLALGIKLFNVTGQELEINTHSPQEKGKHELNLSELAPGVYFIELQNEQTKICHKIIKN